VETLGIEVADVDTVIVRVEILLVPIYVTETLGLLAFTALYPPISEFYSGAVLKHLHEKRARSSLYP
jgi:hypothetical protein